LFRFVLRRLLWAIPTLLIVTFVVYVAVRIGTDPVASFKRQNARASAKKIAEYKEVNALYDGVGGYIRGYFTWLRRFLSGDWPNSIKGNQPVWPKLKDALANSIVLAGAATIVGISIGLGVGMVSALKRDSWLDSTATTGSFVGLSIPPFVSALVLQLLFGVTLVSWFGLSKPILPVSGVYPPGQEGFDLTLRVRHLILPVFVVAIQIIAGYSRYMRTSLLEVVSSDYLRTARAKGIRERQVLVHHSLRNALIPIVTIAAIDIGAILSGLIITERVFDYPGVGVYFITALGNGDFPQLMPLMVIITVAVVMFNLLADVSYAVLDPRIRLD
jgi:peptide/nickel transport system permease protein